MISIDSRVFKMRFANLTGLAHIHVSDIAHTIMLRSEIIVNDTSHPLLRWDPSVANEPRRLGDYFCGRRVVYTGPEHVTVDQNGASEPLVIDPLFGGDDGQGVNVVQTNVGIMSWKTLCLHAVKF